MLLLKPRCLPPQQVSATALELRVWFGQPQSSPSSSSGPQPPLLSTLGGPWPPPTSHTYHILKVSGELLVLYSKRIQKILTEASVGDEEGDRVNL